MTDEHGTNGALPGSPGLAIKTPDLQDTKARLHRSIISRLDLTKLNLLTTEQTLQEVQQIAREILANEAMPLSVAEREPLITEVRHELFGLGPLEVLLKDPTISDILVNAPGVH